MRDNTLNDPSGPSEGGLYIPSDFFALRVLALTVVNGGSAKAILRAAQGVCATELAMLYCGTLPEDDELVDEHEHRLGMIDAYLAKGAADESTRGHPLVVAQLIWLRAARKPVLPLIAELERQIASGIPARTTMNDGAATPAFDATIAGEPAERITADGQASAADRIEALDAAYRALASAVFTGRSVYEVLTRGRTVLVTEAALLDALDGADPARTAKLQEAIARLERDLEQKLVALRPN